MSVNLSAQLMPENIKLMTGFKALPNLDKVVTYKMRVEDLEWHGEDKLR